MLPCSIGTTSLPIQKDSRQMRDKILSDVQNRNRL